MLRIGFYVCVCTFLAGVALATFFALHAPSVVLLTLALVGSVAGYCLTRSTAAFILFLGILAFTLGGARTTLAPRELPPQFAPYVGKRIAMEGVVASMPDERESSQRITVTLRAGEVSTDVLAVSSRRVRYYPGDRVQVSGTLTLPEPFGSDGDRVFAYDRFLAKDGVFGIVQPAQVTAMGREAGVRFTVLRWLQYAHDRFSDALSRALPDPESALASGLLIGGKQGIGKALLETFTISGLLPIVVLSGYNVMIVADGVRWILRPFPKRVAFGAAALSIVLFVLAADAGSSAVRAGIMTSLAVFARSTHRTYDALRALCLALVLMVAISPYALVYDPGLQFSCVATVGLILGSPVLEYRLRNIRPHVLRATLATTLAAQAAVLPLLLYQTGNLSLVSVMANVLVLPVVPLAMAASAIAATFSFLPIPGTVLSVLALPAYASLAYIIHIAELAARVPLAQVVVPPFPFWTVPIAYVLLFAAHRSLKRTRAATGVATRVLRAP